MIPMIPTAETPLAKPSLEEILAAVRKDLERRRREKTLRQHLGQAGRRKDFRDFGMALRRKPREALHWIGEIKRASPSAGILRPDLEPKTLAALYASKGASAVSVLTEATYFKGTVEDMAEAREAMNLPILRKDFTLDEYQIVEAAARGADAVLLIAAILPPKKIAKFLKAADDQNLAALVEVHDTDEMNRALDEGALMLGINNRNLKTLAVDLGVTAKLFGQVPKGMIAVSESGYRTRQELQQAGALGLDAVLIGETLMKSPDIARTIDQLFGDGSAHETA